MNLVIDDHLLREVLLHREPEWVCRARQGDPLVTTGCWYYRLAGALQDPGLISRLSGPVAELPTELRAGVVQRVVELPASIELFSLRELGWSAAGLSRRHSLNLLAAEALAAAMEVQGGIATAEPNLAPRLQEAAEREGVPVLTP